MSNKTEEVCAETGFGCEWIWDDYIDEDGVDRTSMYFTNCYRSRDWSLDEYNNNS